jgi:hypothetical protein
MENMVEGTEEQGGVRELLGIQVMLGVSTCLNDILWVWLVKEYVEIGSVQLLGWVGKSV